MSINEELRNNNKPIDSIKIIDYVISIQLSKINEYAQKHNKSAISDESEKAMCNLIKLIELRNSYLKENSKKRY